MKLELLVIVNHQVTVNRSLGLVHTARHAMGVGCRPKEFIIGKRGELYLFLLGRIKAFLFPNPEPKFGDHGEVVTW